MNFTKRVYNLVSKVPKGKVVTYGQIAKKLNSKAYRAIGTAMNKNPYAPKVACHRVINSDGKIGGFAERLCENRSAKRNINSRARSGVSGTKEKIKMLKQEGIIIVNGKIDLKKFGYKF